MIERGSDPSAADDFPFQVQDQEEIVSAKGRNVQALQSGRRDARADEKALCSNDKTILGENSF